jgi:hypothetical protein
MAETDSEKEPRGVSPAPVVGTLPTSAVLPASDGSLSGAVPDRLGGPQGVNVEGRSCDLEFPQRILNIGFMAALVLAATSLLVGAFYLFFFLWKTSSSVEALLNQTQTARISSGDLKIAISAQLVIAKVALLSCSILVGMAFGFLGFSLFLIGVRAELDAEAGKEDTKVKLARMSPGVFVILCAAVMISVSATHPTPFTMGAGPEPGFVGATPPPVAERASRSVAPPSSPVEQQVSQEFLKSLKTQTKSVEPEK